jgi:hypothetical protein
MVSALTCQPRKGRGDSRTNRYVKASGLPDPAERALVLPSQARLVHRPPMNLGPSRGGQVLLTDAGTSALLRRKYG